jgi:hypothetical protein
MRASSAPPERVESVIYPSAASGSGGDPPRDNNGGNDNKDPNDGGDDNEDPDDDDEDPDDGDEDRDDDDGVGNMVFIISAALKSVIWLELTEDQLSDPDFSHLWLIDTFLGMPHIVRVGNHGLKYGRTYIEFVPFPETNSDSDMFLAPGDGWVLTDKGQVVVKFPDGTNSTFEMLGRESVYGLKRKITDKKGIPIDEQRLLYRSNELPNQELWFNAVCGSVAWVELVRGAKRPGRAKGSPWKGGLLTNHTTNHW